MARKCELIEPAPSGKRYIRRDKTWQFQAPDDLRRDLAKAQEGIVATEASKGQGDRGDRNTGPKS